MINKIVNSAYLIGILIVVMFTLLRSSLPGVYIEYQLYFYLATVVIVGVGFYLDRKFLK